MNRFSGDEQFDDACDTPDNGEGALRNYVSDYPFRPSCCSQHTGKNGKPLFKDWKFHQGVFLGIGFHNKIIASQVIEDDANSTARSRSAIASRQ